MKFRKKPVVVDAVQITEEYNGQWPEWLTRKLVDGIDKKGYVTTEDNLYKNGGSRLVINTLEGDMIVEWNDWIIKGVKGELYPCKPDVFEMTYEAVGNK